ncbi:MAG: photosystem reaction center subunit H [Maricaulis sp.]|jgi:sporulation protein YlmC with PRC-barrel domain|nr:photosystem reaction center subunit H [Maricaulis sp.]HAQ34054.1 photosystem reaction center subunit H [Alphaproteobacteria bacterium]
MTNHTNFLLSSSSISGDSVVNSGGDDLGHVKDLMVDPVTGKVDYAVLSFGGFLGMGDKYFAVPFNQFSVDRENKRMVLNVDKERLKDAPGFDKDDWPDFADPRFRDSVSNFYAA